MPDRPKKSVHIPKHVLNICIRDRSRFFDQVGHQTTNASIGNKHFFTKYSYNSIKRTVP